MRNKAFTFTEILVVLAIVALLASILFPALARAKLGAKQTQSISNLKQCAVAMALYMNGAEIADLPSYETAKGILSAAPTCDGNDYLRESCSQPTKAPLIGSYAYIRGVDERDARWTSEEEWKSLVSQELPDPYLFVSVYYGEKQVVPFDFDEQSPCLRDLSCGFPTRLVRVKTDTSVVVTNYESVAAQKRTGNHLLFGWGAVFTVR